MFNDLRFVIETPGTIGIRRVAYGDIDVHHGDSIYQAYEEDGISCLSISTRTAAMLSGDGQEDETGKGAARGSKLNVASSSSAERTD